MNRGRHSSKVSILLRGDLGKLSSLPKEILLRILEIRREQTGNYDFGNLLTEPVASAYVGGFTWNITKEGQEYWARRLNKLR